MSQPYFAKALFDYTAVEDTELTVTKGARFACSGRFRARDLERSCSCQAIS
jgi:hypothetical protein